MKNKTRILIVILACLAGLVASLSVNMMAATSNSPDDKLAIRSGPVTVSGKADIGGPFSLVNHHGETVTDRDFHGKALLVYFGFTYCPDTCPATLQIMHAALSKLDDDSRKHIQPVLISIDPQRDTAEKLALYVTAPYFPQNLIGLTGTAEQIANVAKAYRIYYERREDDGSMAEYLMNHTDMVFLMNEHGELADVFARGTDIDTMAGRLKHFLEESQL